MLQRAGRSLSAAFQLEKTTGSNEITLDALKMNVFVVSKFN